MNATCFLACSVAACLAMAGCSSTPVAMAPAAKPVLAAMPAAAPASAAAAARPIAPALPALPSYLDPASPIFKERSVYFDFDDFSVGKQYAGLLDRHGKYLTSMPKLSIRIEGNTDERGGAEYNLALGQKRAEAVRRALEIYGVQPSQMEAVSWGKERPKAAGHDEASWSQNRRADVVYPGQ